MASTTEDKLRQALASKESVRSAIEKQGVECGTSVPFAQYGQRILMIRKGGDGDIPHGVVAQNGPSFGTALNFESIGKFEVESREETVTE